MKKNCLYILVTLALFGINQLFMPEIKANQNQGDSFDSEVVCSENTQTEDFFLHKEMITSVCNGLLSSLPYTKTINQKHYDKQQSYYHFSWKKSTLLSPVFQNFLFYSDTSKCKNHIKLQRFNI